MSTRRQKERKKKAREDKSKARVVARRHKLDLARREEAQSSRLNHKFRERIEPIVKDPEKKREMEEASKKKREEKLRRNAEILRSLEDEYVKETERKRLLNENLESEGHSTLQDKLGAIEADARMHISGEFSDEENTDVKNQE